MRQLNYGLALVLSFLLLVACGGGGAKQPVKQPVKQPSTFTFKGQLNKPQSLNTNVATASHNTSSLQGALAKVTVGKLNQVLNAARPDGNLSVQSSAVPIRGVNALVLSKLVSAATGETTLFDYQNSSVVAVKSTGEIVGKGEVQPDGSFEVPIPEDELGNDNVALVLADDSTGATVCQQPLENDPSPSTPSPGTPSPGTPSPSTPSPGTPPAPPPGTPPGAPNSPENEQDNQTVLFGASQLQATALMPQQAGTNLFGYSEETGNPESNNVSVEQVNDPSFETDTDNSGEPDYLENCGGADTNTVAVTADFDWQTAGIEERFLYDYGIAIALDYDDIENAPFSAAGLNTDGQLDLKVIKPVGTAQKTAIAMMDVGYIDESKIGYPLTPFFDLNAALNPNTPYITLTNTEHDFGSIPAGMAYISGHVTTESGTPAQGAFVVGFLENETVLDLNFAVADEEGEYSMLLPATGQAFGQYVIFGLNEDQTLLGIGAEGYISEVREYPIDIVLDTSTTP